MDNLLQPNTFTLNIWLQDPIWHLTISNPFQFSPHDEYYKKQTTEYTYTLKFYNKVPPENKPPAPPKSHNKPT